MRATGIVSAVAMAFTLAGGPVLATDVDFPGWYLGVGIGAGEYGGEENGTDFDAIDARDPADDSQPVARILAGYRLGTSIAIEAAYQELGTYDLRVEGQTGGTPLVLDRIAEADAFSITVLGHYPLKHGSFFGRLGPAHWRAEATTTTITAGIPQRRRDDDNGTDLHWGLGYEHRIGSGALRIGYEEIANVAIDADEDDVRFIAFDILLHF